jgi:hypothetical protein
VFGEKRSGRVPARKQAGTGLYAAIFLQETGKKDFRCNPSRINIFSMILFVIFLDNEVVLMERSLQQFNSIKTHWKVSFKSLIVVDRKVCV